MSASARRFASAVGQPAGVRLDRWLCAARFFKTRSLAKAAVDGGKVRLNGKRTKTAKAVTVGDTLSVSRGQTTQTVTVTGLAERRGSATVAATLYAETAASIEHREAAAAMRRSERIGANPPRHRPNKRQRRQLIEAKTQAE